MQDNAKKRLLKLAKIADKGENGVIEEILNLDDRIDHVDEEIKKVTAIAEETQKMEGKPGHTPTNDELLELINPLIPAPIPGKDYVLTEIDKQGIAAMIQVPVVEKIIEKTNVVHETPIIKNIVKEVAIAESATALRDKLESLKDDDRLDKTAIKGFEKMIDQDTLNRAISILDERTQFLINKVSNLAASQGTSGGVSSVSNANGTLTISPTSGAVVASLNLSHANTWSADLTVANGFILKGQYSNLAGSAYVNPDGSAVFASGGIVFSNAGKATVTTFQLTTSPTSGYVLTSDGSGNGTWQAASGGGSPGGTGTNLQYRAGSSTFGGLLNSQMDTTNGYLGLGGSPLSRMHSFALDITIADPTGFSASLVLESLIGTPSDSVSIFYGPTVPSGGSGVENGAYTGYQPGDSVDAYVASYIIDPRDGISILTSSETYLGNVTVGAPDGIDWSGWSGGSGSFIIRIVNNTQATNYSYDLGGATSYADMNVGGNVTYTTFSGITASGISYDFQPFNKALSPSGLGSYMSVSGGDFMATDDSSGNQYWIQHSISGNSGTGWTAVELYDVTSNSYFETALNTYYQTTQTGTSGFPPYPQHYGFLSDGATLTQSFMTYASQSSPSLYFSSGHSDSNITDPNDGQYYSISFTISSIGGGNSTRIVRQDGYHYDVSSYPTSIDSFGSTFVIGAIVDPKGLTSTATIAQNSAASYDQAGALEVISTGGAPIATWLDNSTERMRMGYDPAASTSFIKLANGSLVLRNSSNVVLTSFTPTSVTFNANSSATYSYLIRTPNSNPLFAVFGNTDSIAIGPTANTTAWMNFAAGSSTKSQMNFATSASIPASVSGGALNFDGSRFLLDNSSFRARLLQTASNANITQNAIPKSDANGNLVASSLSDNGSTLTIGSGILANAGIAISSSQNITMGGGSAITGGLRTSMATTAISTSLNQANHSPWIQFTGSTAGRTLTLPTAASVSGIQYGVTNLASVSVTVATTSSQNINLNGTTTTSIVLQPGDSIIFIANASSAWDAFAYYQAIRTVGTGGTGLASYAVGDIIYASGATTLASLADVATGNALISGGVTTAPSWGKIGLTTHVSGILPVANGGTGLSTSRRLFSHHVDQGNGTTVETDLYSDTIAAGKLATNDDMVQAMYGGVFVSSATATREVKLYFGGTAIFDTGALTLSLSSAWTCYVEIIRVSASVIRYSISFATEGAALSAYTAVGELTGLTLANTQVLKITGQAAGVGAATNDIVAKMGYIDYEPV